MNSKTIALFDERDSPWYGFLNEYFDDTSSRVDYLFEPSAMKLFLDRTPPDVLFLRHETIPSHLIPKLKWLRQTRANFRVFHLGAVKNPQGDFSFDAAFLEPVHLPAFQKQMVQHLPIQEKIKVLVVDDDAEIGQMMKDYLESRVNPSFVIHYEGDGRKALARLGKEIFDVIVLDIKMPAMDGREVYRELKARGIQTPVIVFFDAIFGDEMVEIYKYGRPAVVDKGSRTGAMPEMTALIQKMVYFG